jgi:hypothetical protein
MAENFDLDVVNSGLAQLQSERLRAQAEFAEAKAYGNTDAALAAAHEMAEADEKARKLVRIYQDSIPQQQKPKQRQSIMTSNKPIEEYTLEDQLEIVNQTMTGREKLTADDLRKAVADNQGAWDNRPGQR